MGMTTSLGFRDDRPTSDREEHGIRI